MSDATRRVRHTQAMTAPREVAPERKNCKAMPENTDIPRQEVMDFLAINVKWLRKLRTFPFTTYWSVRFAYTKFDPTTNIMVILGKAGGMTHELRRYRIPNPKLRYATTLELLRDELSADAERKRRLLRETYRDRELQRYAFQDRIYCRDNGIAVEDTPFLYVVMNEENLALRYPGSDAVRTFKQKWEAEDKAGTLTPRQYRCVAVMPNQVKHSRIEILYQGNFHVSGGFLIQDVPKVT